MDKARGGLIVRSNSVWVRLLGMTVKDVKAAKAAGIEADDIFHFWNGRTIKDLKKSFDFTDSMMDYLKRALVEIPGGVIQLKREAVERKEARFNG